MNFPFQTALGPLLSATAPVLYVENPLLFKAQFDAFIAMINGLENVAVLVGHQRYFECVRRDKKLLGVEFIQL